MSMIFPGKSGSVSFLTLWSSNFVPKIIQICRQEVRKKLDGRTDGLLRKSAVDSTEVENCNVLVALVSTSGNIFECLLMFLTIGSGQSSCELVKYHSKKHFVIFGWFSIINTMAKSHTT